MPDSPAPARTARPCRTTIHRRPRHRLNRIPARVERHGSPGQLADVDTERGSPGAFGSDPAALHRPRYRVARQDQRVGGGARWMQPWFGAGSRVRQRVEFDTADYDLNFKSRSASRRQYQIARARPDRRRHECRLRILRRPRVARRERRQHLHHRRHGRRDSRRAQRARPVRRGPLERQRSRHRDRGRAGRAHQPRRAARRSARLSATPGFSARRRSTRSTRRSPPRSSPAKARVFMARSAPAFARPMRSRLPSLTTPA